MLDSLVLVRFREWCQSDVTPTNFTRVCEVRHKHTPIRIIICVKGRSTLTFKYVIRGPKIPFQDTVTQTTKTSISSMI